MRLDFLVRHRRDCGIALGTSALGRRQGCCAGSMTIPRHMNARWRTATSAIGLVCFGSRRMRSERRSASADRSADAPLGRGDRNRSELALVTALLAAAPAALATAPAADVATIGRFRDRLGFKVKISITRPSLERVMKHRPAHSRGSSVTSLTSATNPRKHSPTTRSRCSPRPAKAANASRSFAV